MRFTVVVAVALVASVSSSCANRVDDDSPVDDSDAHDDTGALSAANVAAAKATLQDVVLVDLLASNAYKRSDGDNALRMSIVKRGVEDVVDALSLDAPNGALCATLLRAGVIPVLETSPGYRWAQSTNPHSFSSTNIGKARAGLDTAIRQLAGYTGPTSATWTPYGADVIGAKSKLVDVVIPNLTSSTGFTLDSGDNRARMQLIKRELLVAADVLSLRDPARARAFERNATALLEASAGYQHIRDANPNSFATTKMGIAREGLRFFDAKTSRDPVEVLMKPGVFVVDGNAWSPANKGDLLVQSHFGWVAIKIHHGPDATAVALTQSFVDGYHARGIQVGGWGYETTNPEADAAVAASVIDAFHLDFYIADAEAEYKYNSASGAPDPDAYGRSGRFVNAFRALEPNLPAALSTFGARSDVEHLIDIDTLKWRDAGFDLMQQAYLNDYEFYRPSRCVRAALNDGWPIEKIHPTVGIWGGGQTRVVSAGEYLDDLSGTGAFGFSTFIGDQMSDADVVTLGTGVGRGLAD